MKMNWLLSLSLGLFLTLPVLAQTENRSFSVGTVEERPQFLPNTNVVIPENIQKLEAQAKADPNNTDVKFDLLMAYARTSLLDRAWPVALQIDKLDPAYTQKVLKQTDEALKKDPKDQEAYYRSAMASFARSWQIKELAREKYMEPLQKGEHLPDGWWEDFKSDRKSVV